MDETEDLLQVEVVYALPGVAHVVPLQLPQGASIADAIQHSGLLQRCPEIDLAKNQVGIFSTQKPLATRLSEGDRVEIYRPLLIDPKEARRRRAKQQRAAAS